MCLWDALSDWMEAPSALAVDLGVWGGGASKEKHRKKLQAKGRGSSGSGDCEHRVATRGQQGLSRGRVVPAMATGRQFSQAGRSTGKRLAHLGP